MISQREAQRLKKRVKELEDLESKRRSRWASEYPGGVFLGSLTRDHDWFNGRIEAARMLGHAVVVTIDDHQKLSFYALPLST